MSVTSSRVVRYELELLRQTRTAHVPVCIERDSSRVATLRPGRLRQSDQEPQFRKEVSNRQRTVRVCECSCPNDTQEDATRQLEDKSREHAVLLYRISAVTDSQALTSSLRFDPCELQFEDGQTKVGGAVCGEARRERSAVSTMGRRHH